MGDLTIKDIIKAIEPWGKVQLIMGRYSAYFIVIQFNEPIKIGPRDNAVNINRSGKITNTPFHINWTIDGRAILSPAQIGLNFVCLDKFVPLEFYDSDVNLGQKETHNLYARTAKLTDRIRLSGELILKNGLNMLCSYGMANPDIESIIEDYSNRSTSSWEVTYRGQGSNIKPAKRN